MNVEKDGVVLMQYLGMLYRKYAGTTMINVEEVNDDHGFYASEEFIIDIRRILKELPHVYTTILWNDFFDIKEENWWQKKYDENTYKELKNIAVKAFFDCLYV